MPRKCKVCGSEIYYSSRDICEVCYDELPANPPNQSPMKEEEMRVLFDKSGFNCFHSYQAGFEDGKQSAIKEQVDWGEAWKGFDAVTPTWMQTMPAYMQYLKKNYKLIQIPKPCNENTTSEIKN